MRGREQIFLITAPSGSGKTTLCRTILALARPRALAARGILSLPVFRDGVKVAFLAQDVENGEVRPLAIARDEASRRAGPNATATRHWVFDDATLRWGDAVLRRSVPADLLIVDELGPLELERGEGWGAGIQALDSGLFRAALVSVRPSLLEAARAKWPRARVVRAGGTQG